MRCSHGDHDPFIRHEMSVANSSPVVCLPAWPSNSVGAEQHSSSSANVTSFLNSVDNRYMRMWNIVTVFVSRACDDASTVVPP